MDLVVTTPGVETARIRATLDTVSDRDPASASDCRLVVERATRCGSIRVDPTQARRLRVAVVSCGVSLQAADRLCRRLAHTGRSVDSVIVCNGGEPTPTRRLADRFDCPVKLASRRAGGRRSHYSQR